LIRLHQGDGDEAVPLARAALAIGEHIDDPEIVAHAIHVLGVVAESQQRWEEAELLLKQALSLWRPLGARAEEAVVLLLLSGVAYGMGDGTLSAGRAEEALARYRAIGHTSGEAMALCRLARLARDRRDYQGAAARYHDALRLWVGIRDRWYIAHALSGLAELASAQQEAHAAAVLLGGIDALAQEAGAPLRLIARVNYDSAAAAARDALGEKRFAALRAEGQRLALDEVVAIAAAVAVPTGATGKVLTPREHDVLRLVARAHTDREIAAALFLSPRTVNAHVASILGKLGVSTRREAATRARELDLLPEANEAPPHT
jgi:non-specific serine/threonine protein kinase